MYIYWPNLRKHFVSEFEPQYFEAEPNQKLFTTEELASFDGVHNEQFYLSILGSVYDVSKGIKHYGPEGNYNYFVGKVGRQNE